MLGKVNNISKEDARTLPKAQHFHKKNVFRNKKRLKCQTKKCKMLKMRRLHRRFMRRRCQYRRKCTRRRRKGKGKWGRIGYKVCSISKLKLFKSF